MLSSDLFSPFQVSTESALQGHRCVFSRLVGCKDWSRTAAGLPWVTARVACSGSTLGSVRMAVVVLRRRSELRTTEGNDRHRLHIMSKERGMIALLL